MTDTAREAAIERGRALAEGAMQPHEWGYRDPVVGGFVEDRTPFDLADHVLRLLLTDPRQPSEGPVTAIERHRLCAAEGWDLTPAPPEAQRHGIKTMGDLNAMRGWFERRAALEGDLECGVGPQLAEAVLPPVTADEGWRPIESAPRDGTEFIATVRVFSNSAFSHHDMHIVAVDDETGELANHYEQGWRLEDYEFWRPLPAPPTGEGGGL